MAYFIPFFGDGGNLTVAEEAFVQHLFELSYSQGDVLYYDSGALTNKSMGEILLSSINVETPSGLINGSNAVYTTTKTINIVIAFSINGQAVHPSEYTKSTNQITFLTPIDSSLSGLPFTIVYA